MQLCVLELFIIGLHGGRVNSAETPLAIRIPYRLVWRWPPTQTRRPRESRHEKMEFTSKPIFTQNIHEKISRRGRRAGLRLGGTPGAGASQYADPDWQHQFL